MDYKKAAQEMFEILILESDIEAFNLLCSRYPELVDEYVRKTEEEIKDIELPEETAEEKQAQWERLCVKIRAEHGKNAI